MPIGTNVTGKMVTALKRLGFNKVFDTNTGADFTIMEEAHEFVERFKENDNLPMITSCSPGWVKYIEMNYPELLPHLSTCKSPHQMFGALVKTYFAKREGIDPSKIYMVSVMPCIAKKFERQRAEMKNDGLYDVDNVITTRELSRMIKQANIEFTKLEDSKFDNPMGEATGAGAIFGTTGGVMEAALRTASYMANGKDIEKIEFEDIRGYNGVKEANIKLGNRIVRVAAVDEIANALPIIEDVKNNTSKYDYIEVMNCRGGCIGGGGQPLCAIPKLEEVKQQRAEGLYRIDQKRANKFAHNNKELKLLYKNYLKNPLGEKSMTLLQTTFIDKSSLLNEKK